MKLLIAGSKTKFFHLKEFGDAIAKHGIDYQLVHDAEIYDGFPSRKVQHWIQTTSRFNKLIDEFKPNAVLVDRQRHVGLAALKSKIPLLILLRGDFWSEIEWAKNTLYKSPLRRVAIWQWEKIAKKCFEGAKVILPICKYLHNIARDRYPDKSMEVLYQGIDPARWYPVPSMGLKHPCVGLLQSATIWGKTKELFTLTKVLENMSDVTFYWVGDGPYRNDVLSVLGKYDNFKWLGSLEYPDKVREYLSEIDVYVLASGIDMSPLTLQEAQLMEKPVVATNVGGIPELMKNDETGFLVEKGDHEGWINKLSILINDNKKAKQMGVAGRNYVKDNFSWDNIAGKFVEIMNHIRN